MPDKSIAIVGAGLVGSLMAIYLRKRGYDITVFERRPDMRQKVLDGGRSINLALSARGIRALNEIGISEELSRIAILMRGRVMDALDGTLTFQPYGKEGQYINSIARGDLNVLLMDIAEALGVNFRFDHRIVDVDLEHTQLTLQDAFTSVKVSFDAIVGADGAFSVVRHAMQFTDRFNFSQDYIEHGYKELQIPAGSNGSFQLEKNALHIWPRESFMLIALPNKDGSFTCTLFFPHEGHPSFLSLDSEEKILSFFTEYFPDATRLLPDLIREFHRNPTSSLITVKCYPWVRNNTLLIGDAAHAIVPFYGQGMNAGFEDCRVFNALLDEHRDDWHQAVTAFQRERKPDTDAIAELALDNFVEMRDLVADREFLLRKKIEGRLYELYPERWIPLYPMVTFHHELGYEHARKMGVKQKKIMDDVMKQPDIEFNWQNLNFELLVGQLENPTA